MTLLLPKTLRTFPSEALAKPDMEQSVDADGIEVLHVDAHAIGNLMIHFDAVSEAKVASSGDDYLLPNRIARVDDTLLIEARNMGAYLRHGQTRKIVTEVHVPAGVKVDIAFTAGVVILNGGYDPRQIRRNRGSEPFTQS